MVDSFESWDVRGAGWFGRVRRAGRRFTDERRRCRKEGGPRADLPRDQRCITYTPLLSEGDLELQRFPCWGGWAMIVPLVKRIRVRAPYPSGGPAASVGAVEGAGAGRGRRVLRDWLVSGAAAGKTAAAPAVIPPRRVRGGLPWRCSPRGAWRRASWSAPTSARGCRA